MLFDDCFPYLISLLFVLAIWNELVREKRGNDLKKVFMDYRGTISHLPSLLQRLLDYLFNKFGIRQLLNPWFFFPFSILFVIYFYRNTFDQSQSIVLLVTFFAIMWYARETFALRNEQKKNNILIAGRPLLLVAKELGNNISVKNSGNNIARQIELKLTIRGGQKWEYKFISLGINQEISHTIPPELTDKIDQCNPNLIAVITYYNFQKNEKYETSYITDESVVIKTGIGRFNQISDKRIK